MIGMEIRIMIIPTILIMMIVILIVEMVIMIILIKAMVEIIVKLKVKGLTGLVHLQVALPLVLPFQL